MLKILRQSTLAASSPLLPGADDARLTHFMSDIAYVIITPTVAKSRTGGILAIDHRTGLDPSVRMFAPSPELVRDTERRRLANDPQDRQYSESRDYIPESFSRSQTGRHCRVMVLSSKTRQDSGVVGNITHRHGGEPSATFTRLISKATRPDIEPVVLAARTRRRPKRSSNLGAIRHRWRRVENGFHGTNDKPQRTLS
jgi:hypothetical protein